MDEVDELTKVNEAEDESISYDLKDLKELEISSIDANSRYYVCNFCKQFNQVKLDDIKNLRIHEKKEKKTVHMEIDRELAIIFKKFCTNFGSYEGGIIALLNTFQIKHEAC